MAELGSVGAAVACSASAAGGPGGCAIARGLDLAADLSRWRRQGYFRPCHGAYWHSPAWRARSVAEPVTRRRCLPDRSACCRELETHQPLATHATGAGVVDFS